MLKAKTDILEKPIVLSTEEVNAILAGKKTQVRIPMKKQPPNNTQWVAYEKHNGELMAVPYVPVFYTRGYDSSEAIKMPYHVGDKLYVKEPWRFNSFEQYMDSSLVLKDRCKFKYKADGKLSGYPRLNI